MTADEKREPHLEDNQRVGTTAAAPEDAAATKDADGAVAEEAKDPFFDDVPLPPDGGWGWVVMIASFFTNMIVDGVCYTFGIINVELMNTFPEASKAETALVGSLVPAVYLIVGPFVSILANRFGCRMITIIGTAIAAVFFFISSFSNSITMMMLTYGVMGGVGFGMMYLPSIVMVGHYFDKYRALATGIAVCGSGIGTFVFAPLATYLVQEYNWRGCNIIIAGIILHGIIFGATFRPLSRRFTVTPRSNIMEEIKAEKRRNRTVSGGSMHDGALITQNNEMVITLKLEEDSPGLNGNGSALYPVLDGNIPCNGHSNGHSNGFTKPQSSATNLNHRPSNHVVSKSEGLEAGYQSNGNPPAHTQDPSSRTGSRVSIRSLTRSQRYLTGSGSDKLNPFDRQDALYTGSIAKLPEFKQFGSHKEYIASVQCLQQEKAVVASGCTRFQRRALDIFDFSLLKSFTFIVLCLSGVLVFIGLFTPFVYVQQKAESLGVPRETANLILLVLGVFNTISRIATGAIADRVDSLIIHNVGAIIAGVATCFVPILNSYALLCTYAAVFGIAIAAFIALRSIVFVEMLGLKKLNNAFGLTSLFQGIAVLIGSPVSGALLEQTKSFTASFLVCGCLIILGGVICLPVRRIAAWENSREMDFHGAKGFGSHYTKVNEAKKAARNETQQPI